MQYIHGLEAQISHDRIAIAQIQNQRREEQEEAHEAREELERKLDDCRKQLSCATATAERLGKMFQDVINVGEQNQSDKPFEIQDIILENERKQARIAELEAVVLLRRVQIQWHLDNEMAQETLSGISCPGQVGKALEDVS